jgi:hypothetical protein
MSRPVQLLRQPYVSRDPNESSDTAKYKTPTNCCRAGVFTVISGGFSARDEELKRMWFVLIAIFGPPTLTPSGYTDGDWSQVT